MRSKVNSGKPSSYSGSQENKTEGNYNCSITQGRSKSPKKGATPPGRAEMGHMGRGVKEPQVRLLRIIKAQ